MRQFGPIDPPKDLMALVAKGIGAKGTTENWQSVHRFVDASITGAQLEAVKLWHASDPSYRCAPLPKDKGKNVKMARTGKDGFVHNGDVVSWKGKTWSANQLRAVFQDNNLGVEPPRDLMALTVTEKDWTRALLYVDASITGDQLEAVRKWHKSGIASQLMLPVPSSALPQPALQQSALPPS